MILIEQKENCCGCEACFNICPINCISMEADEDGFKYPHVNTEKCINCGKCERVCPVINKCSVVSEIQQGYAAISRNLDKRMKSSSGGIFSSIAMQILAEGGVVIGCAMSEDCRSALHIIVEREEELEPLYGSKYLQSDINNIYVKTKDFLESDKLVLFSGTPCQIAGLKSFLQKTFNNLLCIDFICHGVPSPLLWKSHVEYIERKKQLKLTNVNFRSKRYKGNSEYGIVYQRNVKTFYYSKEQDSYFQFFLKDLSLRPSCYDCSFKGIDRISDITLGDFWGIKDYVPNLDDGNGVSIVVTHSLLGKNMLDKVSSQLEIVEIKPKDVFVKHNKSVYQSAVIPKEREEFWNDYHMNNYDKLCKKYATVSMKDRIKGILRTTGLLIIFRKLCNRGGVSSNEFGIFYYFISSK